MIATLFVFGFVIERCERSILLNLYLTCREVTLEILAVGSGIPQAPFGITEEFELLLLCREIGERHALNLCFYTERHKMQHAGSYTRFLACDTSVIETMTTFVGVQWRFARFPPWIPNYVAIFDVEIATAVIHRNRIIAIACDTTKLSILVECVATCGITN